MPNIIEISHLSHPGLEVFVRLTGAQLRNRLEPEQGVFIAESPMVIDVALRAGCQPLSLLTDRRLINSSVADIMERCGDIPIYVAEQAVLTQLTGFALTRGALCAMRRPALPTVEDICRGAHRLAVIEGVTDTTNIGALFRSAAALGMDGVLVTPTCCDPLCRRAVRVSMGTVLQVPWTRIGAEPSDWPEKGLAQLNALGFRTAAMALTDQSVSIDHPALKQEPRLAVVLGTEGDGLAKSTIAHCNYTVRIPMAHGVDSLNVAAAGAVAFWELRAK